MRPIRALHGRRHGRRLIVATAATALAAVAACTPTAAPGPLPPAHRATDLAVRRPADDRRAVGVRRALGVRHPAGHRHEHLGTDHLAPAPR